MKLHQFVIGAGISATIVFSACNSKNEKPVVAEEVPAAPTAIPTPEGAAVPRPDQNIASRDAVAEPHYKCPNNDGGIGTGPGKCSVCGTDMEHNLAYHQNGVGEDDDKSTGLGSSMTSTQQAAQPTTPQNVHGDWHFICSKGCEGGSGTGGKCPKCGAPLKHNSVYHQ